MKTLKYILLTLLLSCTAVCASAQDVILKKDNSTIISKVTKISKTEIEYKKWSNLDGPTYTIDIVEIVSINYQNGEIEYFSNQPESPTNSQLTTNQQSEAINQKSDFPTNGLMNRSGKHLTLDSRVLSDDEVLELVGYENYQTYLEAKQQMTTARALAITALSLFAVPLLTSCVYFVITEDYDAETILVMGEGMAILIDIVCLPIILFKKGFGSHRLDWVANEYNIQQYNSMSFSVIPSLLKCEIPQLQNNYGLGLTFSFNF